MFSDTQKAKLERFRAFRAHFDEWVVKDIEDSIGLVLPVVAFIMLSCAIEWLAGFYVGHSTVRGSAAAYTKFVGKYLDKYEPDELYDSLRNGLVHMYTIKHKKYALTDGNPDSHREPDEEGRRILNIEDFFQEWVSAKDKYFDMVEDIEKDSTLLDNAIERLERDGFLSEEPRKKIRQVERNMRNRLKRISYSLKGILY